MHQTKFKQKKRYTYIFLISLVLLVICAITLAFQFAYILPNWLSLNILLPCVLLISSFFYIVWYISPSLDFENHFGKALFAVIASLTVISGTVRLTANVDKLYDMKLYTDTNLKDVQSKEFALVKALGKDNNVLIRLGNPKNAWAMSRLNLPGSSGASITIENAHCKLNYNSDSIRDFHAALAENLPDADRDIDISKLTIMMHELAHCLDIKRDFVTFNLDRVASQSAGNIIIGNHAIAPQYRSEIKPDDIETYYVQAQKSVLWKEVFSDVYSIGYLYIQHPEYAVPVKKRLMDFRTEFASIDPTHNTSCWLATIENSVKPTKINDLIAWSDQIRDNSDCNKK